MQRSQRCVWPFPLIDRAVHCNDCLGHYLCYHNCACHEPHTAVFHVSWTWTKLTCGTDLLLPSLVSTCFVLTLLDYENLCQWVVGLPRELRIAQHITQRKDKT